MKKKTLGIFTVLSVLIGLIPFSAPANAGNIEILVNQVGIRIPSPIMCPASGKTLDLEMTVVNPLNEAISAVEMYFLDKDGSSVRGAFAYSVKPNSETPLYMTLVELPRLESCTEITQAKVTVTFGYGSKYQTTRKVQEVSVSQLGNPNPIHIATPTPTPSVTSTPVPAPTVTVTATPSPAPAVTVTAQANSDLISSKLEVSNLKLSILENENKLLKAKLKKICSAKPKPKGC